MYFRWICGTYSQFKVYNIFQFMKFWYSSYESWITNKNGQHTADNNPYWLLNNKIILRLDSIKRTNRLIRAQVVTVLLLISIFYTLLYHPNCFLNFCTITRNYNSTIICPWLRLSSDPHLAIAFVSDRIVVIITIIKWNAEMQSDGTLAFVTTI